MRSVFYGTKGTITTDNTSPSMTLYSYQEDPDHPDGILSETEIPININSHNTAGEFEAFYEAIRTGRPVDTPAAEGANTIAVCHAIIQSSLTGQPVRPVYFQ